MGMMSRKRANTLYIKTNLKKSGMEIWRRLNKDNDPKTFTTSEGHLRQITELFKSRCKDMTELIDRMEKIKMQTLRFMEAGGVPLTEIVRRHNLMSILPPSMIQYMQIQDGFVDWTYETIEDKIRKIMNAQNQYNMDNAQSYKSALFYTDMEDKNEKDESAEDEHECKICGYDYDTNELVQDMLKHIQAGFAGYTEEGWCCTENTRQAIQNVRKRKRKRKTCMF